MKHLLLLGFIYLAACFNPSGETKFIDSNAHDERTASYLLDSSINRRYLSIPAFNDSDVFLQYLSEDEWGMYFSLLRISNTGYITLIEQDSFSRLHSMFKYKLSSQEQQNIGRIVHPILSHQLTYPDPSRNLIDGGNNSIIFAKQDSVYIRYWQYNKMLPQNDLMKIEALVDSLKQVVQRKKNWSQE